MSAEPVVATRPEVRRGDARLGTHRKRPAVAAANARDIDAYRQHMIAIGRSAGTIHGRMPQLRTLSIDMNVPLRSLSTNDLMRWFAAHPNWAPATRYSNRATLRDFYRFMVDAGLMRHNPAEKLPAIRVPHQNLPAAPEQVVDQAREAIDPRVQLMVELGARQGLRRGEIVGIHSHDLVPTPEGWQLIVHGKGGKDRTVPLHDDIAERILAAGRGWLFPSPKGGHISANWAGVLISRELGPGWTAHSLRRRFGTRVYEGERNLRAVQLLLGHADVSTTQRYIDTQSSELRDALRYS